MSLTWRNGRLILEVDATIRVPVEIVPIAKALVLRELALTRREQQVLDGLLKGLANKEIADRLNVSTRTVKFHVSTLLEKFGVKNRAALQATLGGEVQQLPKGKGEL